MANQIDITQLKTSWTKYDIVQVINIVGNNELNAYLTGEKAIDEPIFRAFLGIDSIEAPLPKYWIEIQKYPQQVKLFSLAALLFTHYQNISDFAELYSKGNMGGVFHVEEGKRYTNLRSALVEGEAALRKYRRTSDVPYNFSKLYQSGDVGKLFKQLLKDRLTKVGWATHQGDFYEECFGLEFEKVLSLTRDQFKKWLEGDSLESTYEDFEPINPHFQKFKTIQGLKVNQWLNEWNDINFVGATRRKPPGYFILFKMDARLLKRLSDVHRRKADKARTKDGSVQRKQSTKRSEEIEKYIRGGFPWSTIKENQQSLPEFQGLKMPGILPTAIIANILGPNQIRNNSKIADKDLITIDTDPNSDIVTINLPDSAYNENWNPQLLPIEIIDGQHRLLAFDDYEELDGNYELPIVAYYNLDLTWQAYLFYTINIKPVKINTSLGFDLYPLLRTQEWLENSRDGLLVYRETRAQEVVEALWLYPGSPWQGRINMLGEAGGPTISQAAFIRTLTNSFFKASKERANAFGGLFGDILDNKNNQVVNWNRAQQAGFLILLWDTIANAIKTSQEDWANILRSDAAKDGVANKGNLDIAFTSKNSLLARDQGVRGVSLFANDFFYVLANSADWDLNDFYWGDDLDEKTIEIESISEAIRMFKEDKLFDIIEDFSAIVAKFDWRTTSASFSSDSERNKQALYKGSSGYKEIWKGLVELFSGSSNSEIEKFTSIVSLKQ